MAKRYRSLPELAVIIRKRLNRDPSGTAKVILGILEDSLSPTQKQTLKITVCLADPEGTAERPKPVLISRHSMDYGSQDSPSCPELDRLVSAQVWDLKAILAVLRQTIRGLPKGNGNETLTVEVWHQKMPI